ncbi:MAG: right-handed parallel beta-helix repeat-containing protein [Thermodesulfobacteriota bacterium]
MKIAPLPFGLAFLGLLLCLSISPVRGATFNVNNPSEFQTALTTAAGNGQDDVVNVAAGSYNLTSTLQYASVENYALVINGAGRDTTILNGGAGVRLLSITTNLANANVTIQDLGCQNGATTESGGGLQISVTSASITLSNCLVSNCAATGGDSVGGGANLTTDTGDLTVTASIFRDNSSAGNVGGLFTGTNSGIINLTNCTFDGNSVFNSGGSTYFGDGGGAMLYSDGTSQMNIRGNTFTNNVASGGDNPDGGGMMVYPLGATSTVTMEDNTFTNNRAGLGGGGCEIRLNAGGTLIFGNNTFTGNRATIGSGAGAMIHLDHGSLSLTDNTFSNNQCAENGGGVVIEMWSGTATLSGNAFTSNQAGQNGGGVSLASDTATTSISKNVFNSNNAGNVGGGFSYSTTQGAANIFKNTFYGNSVTTDGGGIYLYLDQTLASVTLSTNILWQNTPNAFNFSFGAGSAPITMIYSDVQNSSGESWFGAGCIALDPLFVNPANGDFNLQWTDYPIKDGTKSPCIDAGDPSLAHDPDNTRADMGTLPYFQSRQPKSQAAVNLLLLLD